MRREIRLRRGADFERVRANRRSWAHPLLICTMKTRDDDGPSRIGIIVGRRVGNAVTRNRVKRRIREVGRALYAEIRTATDVVFIARPAAAQATFADVQAAFQTLIKRAHLQVISDAQRDPT